MTSPSNQEQIDYWNGEAGATWVSEQERVDNMLAPLSEIAIDRAATKAGERILDIGCGCGATSLKLADKGAVVQGLDISAPMLARATERSAGLDNVSFIEADAATATFTPDHDLLFSRFGVMFFADPFQAFKNLRSALKPDGRLMFMCWQKPAENPWMIIGGRAVQPFLSNDEPTPDPRAPGPFAFAEPEYVSDILASAGFSEINIEGESRELFLGATLQETLAGQMKIGPLARAMKTLQGDVREQALEAVKAALAPNLGPDGIRLGASVWLVLARA